MQTESLAQKSEALSDAARARQIILAIPLTHVIKREYALQLQQVLKLYTVGNLLGAWRSPDLQRSIEDVFDCPEQAHQAIATCAAWLGFHTVAAPNPAPIWWHDEMQQEL